MSDKSQLERDIERRELVRTPPGVLILIALLSFGLGALGVYTYKLKQELSTKEHEIVMIKSNFEREKALLLDKLRGLEKERGTLEPELESMTDKPTSKPQAMPLQGEIKKHDDE